MRPTFTGPWHLVTIAVPTGYGDMTAYPAAAEMRDVVRWMRRCREPDGPDCIYVGPEVAP